MTELLHYNGRVVHHTILNRRNQLISVLEAGQTSTRKENNPVVVLHHGFGSCWQGLAPQIDFLATKGYRVLAIERSGHGATPFHERKSVQEHVEDVEDVLNHLGVKSADHGGHSYGSKVMLEYAAKNPGKVRRLFGISMFDDHTDLMRFMGNTAHSLFRRLGVVKQIQQIMGLVTLHWSYENQAIGKEVIAASPAPTPAALADEFFLFSGHQLPAGERMKKPLLAIQSERDGIIPEDSAAKIRLRYDNVNTITLSDCASHNPHIEHADTVNALIHQFLTGAAQAGKSNSQETVHAVADERRQS